MKRIVVGVYAFMWFWFSVIALLCWSGADVFAKLGCQEEDERFAYLKMVTAVGTVMGLHALYTVLVSGVRVDAYTFLRYLPVSALYISSMALGYLGMRYIELSILSPVCNSSGALVAVMTIALYGIGEDVPAVALVAVALECVGVIALGITEAREDEELRRARQDSANRRYAKSWIALAIPLLYCLLDALGTFADGRVLQYLDEDAANTAYELTFFAVGLVCAVYVFGAKKQPVVPRSDGNKWIGALFETAGQFFYIYAMADTAHVAFTAPVVSSYCAVSVLWGRIFLKEKLSEKHYLSLAAVLAGIVIMGILDI